ncbi:hypothetical protein OY671_008833, partial [Metschnikowia pulcherrima]
HGRVELCVRDRRPAVVEASGGDRQRAVGELPGRVPGRPALYAGQQGTASRAAARRGVLPVRQRGVGPAAAGGAADAGRHVRLLRHAAGRPAHAGLRRGGRGRRHPRGAGGRRQAAGRPGRQCRRAGGRRGGDAHLPPQLRERRRAGAGAAADDRAEQSDHRLSGQQHAGHHRLRRQPGPHRPHHRQHRQPVLAGDRGGQDPPGHRGRHRRHGLGAAGHAAGRRSEPARGRGGRSARQQRDSAV